MLRLAVPILSERLACEPAERTSATKPGNSLAPGVESNGHQLPAALNFQFGQGLIQILDRLSAELPFGIRGLVGFDFGG